LIAAL
jgi:hypothetical protein